MPSQVIVALVVAGAVIGSVALSRRTRIPEPCFLVLAGLGAGLLPGVAEIRLPPQLVFYGFLPPLIYAAAFLTAPREVRENWRSILLLAVGLTAATVFAIGGVAWGLVASLGAGGSFLLGAVLSPTDPVSSTAVIGATSAPERLRTILEAESLVNDGVGLVAFAIALHAVEHGSFSVTDGLLRFVVLSAGGVALGVVVAAVVEAVRRRIHEARIELPLSLLTPYLAYIPAERLHVSGILATVACGVYLGWRSEGIFRADVRVQSVAFWDTLTFILGSILFVLLGTQVRPVIEGLGSTSTGTLVGDAALVFAAALVVRMTWMFTVPHFVAVVGRSRAWAEVDPWRDRVVLGWSGMRGALSLAAALSIPATVAHRDEILFLTFTTIVAGLVVLGIPLPWLLGRLGFGPPGSPPEEHETRLALAEAALGRLDELEASGHGSDEHADVLRLLYENRLRRLETDEPSGSRTYRDLRLELLQAERDALRARERQGLVGSSFARALELQLDHEEAGLRS